MKILITGAAGFIGSHLCEHLVRLGHEVIGVDNFASYYARKVKEGNLHYLRSSKNFSFFERDLVTDDLRALLQSVEFVVHAAAMPGLPKSWTEFDSYVRANLIATERLLQAIRTTDLKKFVYISTSSVYGADAIGDERQYTKPISPYGVTKLAGEKLVDAFAESFELPAIILRYFSVYGPRQRPDMAYNIFIRRLLAREPLEIMGDGEQSRSSTYVEDCVKGTIAAVESAPVGSVFNIGGGETISINKAVALLFDIAGYEVPVRYRRGRSGDQVHTAADTSAARAAFGYKPEISMQIGLRQQFEWQQRIAHALS